MADMQVEIAGLRFPNPVLSGAGPLGSSGKQIGAVAAAGAGGVVTRTISVVPAPDGSAYAEIRGGVLNTQRWSSLSPEQWLQTELPRAREAADAAGVPLIVSIGYTGEEVAQLAEQLAPFADAFELSGHFLRSSPGIMSDPWSVAAAARGERQDFLARDPAPLLRAIHAAHVATQKPIFVKVGALEPGDLAGLARQIEAAGAEAIVATNAYGPVSAIDIERGQFLLDTPDGQAWLSGSALKPLSLRCVFDIARAVSIPVIGVGGISRPEDVAEYLMAGASAVQVTSGALKTGPKFFGRLVERTNKWLDERGYSSIADIHRLGIRRWESLQPHRFTVPVLYDEAECIGCRLCEVSCHYDAIYMVPGTNKTGGDQVAEFNADRCFGCGLCVVRCPTDALLMPMLGWDGTTVHPKSMAPTEPGLGSIKQDTE